MQETLDPRESLWRLWGSGDEPELVEAPGRVNLIGEHIDYHQLAVLPMALRRRVRVAFRARNDSRIRAASDAYGRREFDWTGHMDPVAHGDWENYLRAAAQAVGGRWGVQKGVDAVVASDLPAAAGLSSSSALLVAFSLALLKANGMQPGFAELMEVLPDGEHFVGTRGGGMDHAASLESRKGCASLVGFAPLAVKHIAVPQGWSFLVAHSLHPAEKSGAAREEYNLRRAGGTTALARLGFASYAEALPVAVEAAARLPAGPERDAFLHVTSEAIRVRAAVAALEQDDAGSFGQLLLESHASLRDRLRVSCDALDSLVKVAMYSGALGARLTGAGFGGCVVILCRREARARLRQALITRFYGKRAAFDEHIHLINASPANGALHLSAHDA
jgi:galactokinase